MSWTPAREWQAASRHANDIGPHGGREWIQRRLPWRIGVGTGGSRRTIAPVARAFAKGAVSWRTGGGDHDSQSYGVAFGKGALLRGQDLGAPEPRKQSNLSQRKDPLGLRS